MISVIETSAGVATAGAFIFGIKSYLRFRKTEQIRIIESIFKDIRQLENERAIIKKNSDNKLEVDDWNSRYFATVEWLSYLVNKKELPFKMVKEFFDEILVMSFEHIYKTNFSESYLNNEKHLPEFKKLYKKLKE